MQNELETRWSDLVKSKQDFLEFLSNCTDDQLSASTGNEWSANQVMEHLLSSESGTLGYMKKKSGSGWDALETTGQENIAASLSLNERLNSTMRIAAPSILPEPTNQIPFAVLDEKWNVLRTEFHHFIQSIEPVHYDKLVFRQPFAGMLNILQTLEFMRYHIEHHIHQLHRIKAIQGF